jgi:hypothetical protein
LLGCRHGGRSLAAIEVSGSVVPASYKIDKVRGVVLSHYSGHLTDDDILGHQRRLIADPEFDPTFRQLLDMREVEELAATAEGIRQLARGNPFVSGSRRAGVASRDVVFGMARMFEMMREQRGDEFRMFRSMDEALDWLDLEPDPQ